ncbi:MULTISPECIES: flagellar FliJ family protein [Curtobacterium]|uniref:flagellar FliJ family protein n=1 Tax=Curtobacterium TaxID=2034 RepID=UPI0018E4FF4D|nr:MULTISPECIES: flagellar FliJ family protein [Curtobacterium]MCA5923513.1 flagellar FliJ family protein [Curtobacterium oceanosedimentum]QQD77543.1 flagellar FliJ family protein [Curtobacterium sp. YC1]
MARRFPLAGLLRLRHTEQDRAAASLAAANERVRDAADARIAARRSLADSEDVRPIEDAATLSAVAAARAATRGMLEELDAVVQSRRADADRAQEAYGAARRAAVGLEKLEGKHAEQQAAEELRAEQGALDEIAARRRTEGGSR